MPRWTVSSPSPINFDAFRSVFSGCRLLFDWGSSVHGHHQRSLPHRDQWASLQPPSLQCICIFISNYCHLCCLLLTILSRFCGYTTTQMGPLLSTQSHRTVSDHYCTLSPCKSGINGALFQVSCSSTILSPTFAPFSKKMHFWVFLLFCIVPFWDVEWAKAYLNGLTHINVISHLTQPTNLTKFVNLTRSKAGWCWP